MSALGQKRTCAVQKRHVRFTPESDILCGERNDMSMVFPTRFPTELLDTGWEKTASDRL